MPADDPLHEVYKTLARLKIEAHASSKAWLAAVRLLTHRAGIDPKEMDLAISEAYDDEWTARLLEIERQNPGVAAALDERPLPSFLEDDDPKDQE